MDERTGRRVVVGVDRSASARDAVEWAADLARARHAALHLVHVVPGGVTDAPIRPVPDWLAALDVVVWRDGVDEFTDEVRPGTPVEVLADRTRGAEMLVLGSYGDGAWWGMPAGSVALDLIGRARCPVAIVRGSNPGQSPPLRGPVVVGADDSPGGRAAVEMGAELAEALGAPLILTRTWTDVVDSGHGPRPLPQDSTATGVFAAAGLDDRIAHLARSHPGVVVHPNLQQGTPVRVLLEQARTARMVVVGHRTQLPVGPGGMLLGSTSRALVEFAACTVVVAGPRVWEERHHHTATTADAAETPQRLPQDVR